MTRPCDVCGAPYEAQRSSSRFCGVRCRKRAHRAGVVAPHPVRQTAEASSGPAGGSVVPLSAAAEPGVVTAVVAELTAAGRLPSALGQAAVLLATRLERSPAVDTASAVAALARQLQDTLAAALAHAAGGPSRLDRARDELAARRARRG